MNLKRYRRQKIRDAFSVVNDVTFTKSDSSGFIRALKSVFGLKNPFTQSEDKTSSYFKVSITSTNIPESKPTGVIFRISSHPQNSRHIIDRAKMNDFKQERGLITKEMNPYYNLRYVFSFIFPGSRYSGEYTKKQEKLTPIDWIYFSEKNVIPDQTTLKELVDWVNNNT